MGLTRTGAAAGRRRALGAGLLSIGWALLGALAAPAPAAPSVVVLATTTSTQDSGLLDVLVPLFEKQTGHTVKTIAVGTGQALTMGARGEADVVLVHAPELEARYVAEGGLLNRRPVMHNDFVLVGPPADPAATRSAKPVAVAFKRIAERQAPFVSRGDNSGTHAKERALWKAAGVTPRGRWYIESGQGMGATLVIASEKAAYALTDRASYLALRKRLTLAILGEGDAALVNPYHVLEANPARHPRVNAPGGRALADFLVGPEARALIRAFGVEKHGQPLFFPNAGRSEPGSGG